MGQLAHSAVHDLSRRSAELVWPTQIPKQERISLVDGHRSFMHRRRVYPAHLFGRQDMQVHNHALVIPITGSLAVDSPTAGASINPGQALILSNARISISEARGAWTGNFLWFFFDDEVLATALPDDPISYLEARGIAMDWPASTAVIPVTLDPLVYNFVLTSRNPSVAPLLAHFGQKFSPNFDQFTILRTIVPRLPIYLFLERLVFAPTADHPAILTKFPGGYEALRRKMSRLNMPSIRTWITLRRKTLAAEWRYAGVTPNQIAQTLKTTWIKTMISRGDLAEYVSRRRHLEDLLAIRRLPSNPAEIPEEQIQLAPQPPDFSPLGITKKLPRGWKKLPGLENWQELLGQG